MAKVKASRSFAHGSQVYQAGQEFEVPDALAEDFRKADLVEGGGEKNAPPAENKMASDDKRSDKSTFGRIASRETVTREADAASPVMDVEEAARLEEERRKQEAEQSKKRASSSRDAQSSAQAGARQGQSTSQNTMGGAPTPMPSGTPTTPTTNPKR